MCQARRKNGAHRGLVWTLAAAVAALGACAQIEESRRARNARLAPSSAFHEVQRGETLSGIANRYRVDVDDLARANGLRNTARLAPRQRLAIPSGVQRIVHRVQPGETLQDIADRYRVRVSTIAHLNRLGIAKRVPVGTRLLIPSGARPRVAAAPSRRAVAAAPARPAPAPARAAPARTPAPPPAATPSDPRLEHARKLVDRAVADYHAARFDAGLAHAREAEEVLADLGDRADARKLSARAAFVAGSAHAARGDETSATESFARVHELDPNFEPPRGWLSPRLAALYAAGHANSDSQ